MTDMPKFTSNMRVELIQSVGSDEMVVLAARTSSEDEILEFIKNENPDDLRLINYLMRERHGTPFEHALMSFFIDTPIFVWREFHRHRIGWSYNEESQRYKEARPKFWIPSMDRKSKPTEDHKPSKPDFERLPRRTMDAVQSVIASSQTESWHNYQRILKEGSSTELARTVLPLGLYSQGWATCNPRSLMSFLSLRTHNRDANHVSYPQVEIEEVARRMEEMFAERFPVCYNAFIKHGREAP